MPSVRWSILALASLPLFGFGSCGQPTSPPASSGGSSLLVIADDAPTNASACEDRLAFARETIRDVATRANGECSEDSECALVFTETQCEGACQAAILSANVEQFEQAKRQIDDRACTGYMEAGCSYATPRCMQMEAVCEQGRCAMTPATEAAG